MLVICLLVIYKISSANMGFWSATIERYYTGQPLITQLRQRGQATVKHGRINGGKLILSLIYLSYNQSFLTQVVVQYAQ